jgi:hypothetical protein
MRFATRFDRWLVVLLAATAAITCFILPAFRLLNPALRGLPIEIVILPIAIWVVALAATLPQYYEVRGEELFLRLGWRRISIPYEALAELQTMSDSRSAGVFSTERVLVVTQGGEAVSDCTGGSGRLSGASRAEGSAAGAEELRAGAAVIESDRDLITVRT